MFHNERLRVLADLKKASGNGEIPKQAADMNMAASTLRGILSGHSMPSLEMLCTICDYYNVNPDWLLGYSDTSMHVVLKVR